MEYRSKPNTSLPLHQALSAQDWEAASLLIKKGADVNQQSGFMMGDTPLYRAIMMGAPLDLITKLASSLNINNQNNNLGSPLHKAIGM